MFNKSDNKSENVELVDLSYDQQEKLLKHQNFNYAVVGGLFLSILCAILWAVVTVATETQIGFMALGVGIIVGLGVKFFGAGIENKFAFLGAGLAVFGCLLGNFFSQIGFTVVENGMSYLEVLAYIDMEMISIVLKESFTGMDLFFYAFAAYEGFKFSLRSIPENYKEIVDFEPTYNNLRLPFVGVTVVSFIVISFYLSSSLDGNIEHTYPDGTIQYTGKIENQLETGKWEYFYMNGGIQMYGNYKNGKEEGLWIENYESGNVSTKSNYKNGLLEGATIRYYEGGSILDSSFYKMGRLNGNHISYYESGEILSEGNYERSKQEGEWVNYFKDGMVNFKINFNKGELHGSSIYYDSLGSIISEYEYSEGDLIKIINQKDFKGKNTLVNGNGYYKTYYENGKLAQIGEVKSGERIGEWKIYHPNGDIFETAIITENIYNIQDTWYRNGDKMIENGNGNYIAYYDTTDNVVEKGTFQNSKKEGLWKSFSPESGELVVEINYKEGDEHGEYFYYSEYGNLLAEGNYNFGKREGKWSWYYENGILESFVVYENGLKAGKQIFYTELGYEAKEEVYENGNLISEKYLE